MQIDEVVALFAERLATAVVVTGPDLDAPGPEILYANPAFFRMTGYEPAEVIGRSPRLLQGPDTNPLTRREISRALRSGQPIHACLTNYRRSGEAYVCEVDVRPIRSRTGAIEAFIAFEREVVRRPGRPRPGPGGRFRPLEEGTAAELGRLLFGYAAGGPGGVRPSVPMRRDDAPCAPQGQRTVGGMEERIEATLPPVFRPKIVPRS